MVRKRTLAGSVNRWCCSSQSVNARSPCCQDAGQCAAAIHAHNHHVRLLSPEPLVVDKPKSTRVQGAAIVMKSSRFQVPHLSGYHEIFAGNIRTVARDDTGRNCVFFCTVPDPLAARTSITESSWVATVSKIAGAPQGRISGLMHSRLRILRVAEEEDQR